MNYINQNQWNEMVELLEDDFVQLVDGYLFDCENRIKVIKQAKLDNDNEKALDAAHAMKGASVNIGADGLARHCAIMQEVCYAKMIDSAFNIIEDIEKEFACVSIQIKKMLGQMS